MFPAPYSVASQIQENQSRKSVTFKWKNIRQIQITQDLSKKDSNNTIFLHKNKSYMHYF